mmetsp:Transcript_126158/g.223485  ORF Transcript_126158/g.223485 Transcript_126158/m.223485 type:complete len:283 (+) Transcript_126158:134-982(+)
MSPVPCKESPLPVSCFFPPIDLGSPMTGRAMKELGFLNQLNMMSRMTQQATKQSSVGIGNALASFGLPEPPSSDFGTKQENGANSLLHTFGPPPGLWCSFQEAQPKKVILEVNEPPCRWPSVQEPASEQGLTDWTKGRPRNPEIQHARDVAAMGGGLSGLTTVMVQNIPLSYKQSELMDEIDKNGFAGTHDFFSLPVNARNDRNRGFAFINFMSASLADEFYSKYHGQKLRREGSGSLCVFPSDVQGFDQNVACFLASSTGRKKKRQSEPAIRRHVMKTSRS